MGSELGMKWWLVVFLSVPLISIAKPDPRQTSSAPLLLSNSHSWAPMSYMDEGKAKGMLVDFWKLYEKYNGQPVAFRLVDWGASIEAVREGQAQVHAGLLKSPEREKFFLFSDPIFPLVTGLFVSIDKQKEGVAMEIPLGVVSKSYESEYLQNTYPNVDLIFFDNSRELVQAANDKVINAFVLDLPTGMHFIRGMKVESRLVFAQAVYSKPIHAAVALNNQALLDEVQKGIDRIPNELIRALAERKPLPISDHDEDMEDMKALPWMALRAIIFLISLALVWWAIKGLFGFGARR